LTRLQTTGRRGEGSGFTLVEMLGVLLVIAILAGLVGVGFMKAKENSRRTIAKLELQMIVLALEKYRSDHSTWPAELSTGQTQPLTAGSPVLALLDEQNLAFSKINVHTRAPLNPWANPDAPQTRKEALYYVKIDVDYDNEIPAGNGAPDDPPDSALAHRVIAWTFRPGTQDCITSWK